MAWAPCPGQSGLESRHRRRRQFFIPGPEPHRWQSGTAALMAASSAHSELMMRHVPHSAGHSCGDALLHSAYTLQPIAALALGCEHTALSLLCRIAGAGGQACASAPGANCANAASTASAATARE
jgi:hypothetical protein